MLPLIEQVRQNARGKWAHCKVNIYLLWGFVKHSGPLLLSHTVTKEQCWPPDRKGGTLLTCELQHKGPSFSSSSTTQLWTLSKWKHVYTLLVLQIMKPTGLGTFCGTALGVFFCQKAKTAEPEKHLNVHKMPCLPSLWGKLSVVNPQTCDLLNSSHTV